MNLKEDNDEFSILFKGPFNKEQIKLNLLPELKRYSQNTNNIINNTWVLEMSNENQLLYDGQCYSLINMSLKSSSLECVIQETNYKSFVGTNVKNRHLFQNNNKEMANCMAACVVMETTDNKIIIGKRSSKMAEGKSEWHIIGGTLEAVNNLPEHPFELILKEMEEETGITTNNIDSLICLGTAVSHYNNKTEFLFFAKLNLDSKQFEVKSLTATHREEHDKLTCLDSNELNNFLTKEPFAAIGKAAIFLYQTMIVKGLK